MNVIFNTDFMILPLISIKFINIIQKWILIIHQLLYKENPAKLI